MTHLDTSFLVELLREQGRGQRGSATALLERLRDEEIRISMMVACELHLGAELSRNPGAEKARVATLLREVAVAEMDERFAPRYGSLAADLRRRGETIANMDLLIATAALVDDAGLVTRDTAHFERVPGLTLVGY